MAKSAGRLRVVPANAKRMVDGGEAIILDVVEPNTWRQLHGAIKDALRIDPEEIQDRLDELPVNLGIIAYCT